MSEGASWVFAGALIVGGVVYQQELRTVVSAVLGRDSNIVASERIGTSASPRARQIDAEARAQEAERRAAEAEARAREAELRAKRQGTGGQKQASYGGLVELRASRGGHFYASADINGSSVDVLVDTGATAVALKYEDAQRAGIYVSEASFTGRSQTANGVGRYAPVVISQIAIGGVVVENVRAVVLEPGKSQVTLLGMSFLGKLRRTEMRNNTLILEN